MSVLEWGGFVKCRRSPKVRHLTIACQGPGENKLGVLFGFEEFDDDIDVALRGIEAFGYRREGRRKSCERVAQEQEEPERPPFHRFPRR